MIALVTILRNLRLMCLELCDSSIGSDEVVDKGGYICQSFLIWLQ